MKYILKNVLLLLMVSMVFIFSISPVRALTGSWVRTDDGKQYVLEDGNCYKNTMKQIGGKWYYFDEEGYIVTATTITYKNKVYYFGKTGVRATGWITLSDGKHYFSKTGAMAIGTLQINGDEYYFDSDGVMQTDFWKGSKYYGVDGKWDPNIVDITDNPQITEDMVAYYTIQDGKVVDLVSGSEMTGAIVKDGYFTGGTVKLPTVYHEATIETVMVYNRDSKDLPIGNGLSYYGGALLFQEITDPTNIGQVKVPFGGGQTGTNYMLHSSINLERPIFGSGESYWCLAFKESDNSYSLQINDDYNLKSHWANYINKSFTLSSEHQFKNFVVYNRRLTEEEMSEHYKGTKVSTLTKKQTIVGRVTDGIAELGSALAFSKNGKNTGFPKWIQTEKKSGNYTMDDGNGRTISYTISDYQESDHGIDNSKYESIHFTNAPETLYLGYKYALSAIPYPFNVNHDGNSDQFDISWKSSDTSVAAVIDGLVIPQKTGIVTITAMLKGTNISDSCTIQILNKEDVRDRTIVIQKDYQSKNGNSFSDTDYLMTTDAIYDAIDEAYAAGYNHIKFPKINFYAAPTGETYYIPTGMTMEFPEGSTFHMMGTDDTKANGYTYFRMGWDWYDYNIPKEKACVTTNECGDITGYYCKDAHLIIDKYYGEFYKEDDTNNELYDGANEYPWGCTLLNIGRKAQYCTVEVHEANCPTGFFILMGGKVGSQALKEPDAGKINGTDFVSGWINDKNEIVDNNNWISTEKYFKVSEGLYGYDALHEYFLGNWEENVTSATQHLYDIVWYDENKNMIEADRWNMVDDKYVKPDGAKYFRISLQQSELPSSEDEYIRLHPDASSKFCEIRNTNVINSADGIGSIVGATEACWIHDNYVSGDGLLKNACWCLDLEDGWMGMRGTIVENNIFRKYAYSKAAGEYRGADSGVLALASGYNTFVNSNYLGAIAQSNGNVACTHIVNNVVYTMYSGFSGGKAIDIRPKIWAHVYNNIIADQNINEISDANGVVYHYGNTTAAGINKW